MLCKHEVVGSIPSASTNLALRRLGSVSALKRRSLPVSRRPLHEGVAARLFITGIIKNSDAWCCWVIRVFLLFVSVDRNLCGERSQDLPAARLECGVVLGRLRELLPGLYVALCLVFRGWMRGDSIKV